MTVDIALLCDFANTSIEGKLNILGVFDRLFAQGTPVTHPQMAVVVRLFTNVTDRGTRRALRILPLDEDSRMIGQATELGIDIPADAPVDGKINIIVTLVGLAFPRFGQYRIGIHLDGEPIGDVPFSVVPIAPPSPAHGS